MSKAIVPYPEKCTGCRYCMLICSLWHENIVGFEFSRIFVYKPEINKDVPMVCTQMTACNGECISSCPSDAIEVRDDVVVVIKEKCISCGSCEEACPYNAIRVSESAIKCDLCGGDPICVKQCTEKAIVFEETDGKPFRIAKESIKEVMQ